MIPLCRAMDMKRRADDAVPLAAVLGAVLAELRNLRMRLRTSPTTAPAALEHVESILDLARTLEAGEATPAPPASSSVAARVADRFAGFLRRSARVEERGKSCSEGSVMMAHGVRDALRDEAFEVDSVVFVGSWWPGQVAFAALRSGVPVLCGTVVLDFKIERERIVPLTTVRVDEVLANVGIPGATGRAPR